jgi:hypothetical protein
MTYEEAKALADKIKLATDERKEIMTTLKELVPDFEWCEREALKCDFLKTDAERKAYRNALFDAVLWGKQH